MKPRPEKVRELDITIHKIKSRQYTQELNTMMLEARSHSLANTQVSEAILERYKGRNHPKFEMKIAEESKIKAMKRRNTYDISSKSLQ